MLNMENLGKKGIWINLRGLKKVDRMWMIMIRVNNQNVWKLIKKVEELKELDWSDMWLSDYQINGRTSEHV